LARATKLEIDPAFTAAYPGAQGTEVIVQMRDGRTLRSKLDDVIPATPEQIRTRFRAACPHWRAIEQIVEKLEEQPDMSILSGGLAE